MPLNIRAAFFTSLKSVLHMCEHIHKYSHRKHTEKTSEGTTTIGIKKGQKLAQTELYSTKFLWNSDAQLLIIFKSDPIGSCKRRGLAHPSGTEYKYSVFLGHNQQI